MQIKLSQHEIQRALHEFLQARSTQPIKIVGFDLKGTRSEEGMHFLVDMQYEDINYDEEYPLLEPSVPTRSSTPTTAPNSNSEVSLVSQEDTDEIVRINDLMQNNVCGIHNATIVSAVESGSETVRNHYQNKPFYLEIKTAVQNTVITAPNPKPVPEPKKDVAPWEEPTNVQEEPLNIFGTPLTSTANAVPS